MLPTPCSQSATFDPEQYIEQLAWRTQGGDSREGPQDFDAKKMLRAFENTIEELKLLSMRMEERTGKLDAGVRSETKNHAKRVTQLQENNKVGLGGNLGKIFIYNVHTIPIPVSNTRMEPSRTFGHKQIWLPIDVTVSCTPQNHPENCNFCHFVPLFTVYWIRLESPR